MNKFIAAQLPQPDGSNLPENPLQTKYWRTDLAMRAAQEYRDRVRGGQTADQPMPDDLRENLVLVDVEAMNTMYTENLKAAYDNSLRAVKEASGVSDFKEAGMCRYDAENPPTEKPPPDGGGWIIEIRGSTYHKAGRQFVLDTLLRNIAVNGRKDLPLEPAAGAAPPGTPPVPPGAPSAAAPAAADGKPATSALRPDDEQAMMNAIIKDKVRYAFLYRYQTDPDPKPGAFKMINGSYLKDIVAPATAASGSAAAPAAALGGDWEPLTGAGGSNPSLSSGHMGRGGKGGGGNMNVARSIVGGRGESAPGPSVPGPRPAPGNSGGTLAKNAHPRTEFVIMFFWQEPTPSDQLMNLTTMQAPAAAQEIRR